MPDEHGNLLTTFDYEAYFKQPSYSTFRKEVLGEYELSNPWRAESSSEARYRELRGLDMGPAGRKMWESKPTAEAMECPTHKRVLVYDAPADRWTCPVGNCSTVAVRSERKKARPPKQTKTLMEVFGEPSMPSKPHSMKPSHLGLRIEDADDGTSTCILFDVLLNIEIDVTDYVEAILDEHRSAVSLVMRMSNVVRR